MSSADDNQATSGQTLATMRQRMQDMEGTLVRMHTVLKQMRTKAVKSGVKDPLAKANLDMWELMLGHLDKQFEELRTAILTREDLEARRAAMYKQADAKSEAAAQALMVLPYVTGRQHRARPATAKTSARALATELWMRLFLELAFEYGWRKSELLNLTVAQASATSGLIRLEVGETKNDEGREVPMSATIRELVKLAAAGKIPDDHLLTRANGKPIRDFRKAWHRLCVQAGLARWVCKTCEKTVVGKKCECGNKKLRYVGLILHDFRRSASRELRRAGVAESTIMQTGGWKTASVFRRYAIKDPRDIKAAIEKRQEKREQARAEARAENGQQERQTEAEGTAIASTDAVQ